MFIDDGEDSPYLCQRLFCIKYSYKLKYSNYFVAMKTNPWMKLCKGAALALALSYGLTFCHTSIGKSESADADKFRPHYHQSFSKDGMEDADGQFMFWYAPEDKWVKIESADKELRFYQSEDKKEWKEMSSFGDGYGVAPYKFENPVMVELPVSTDVNAHGATSYDTTSDKQDTGNKKWALIVNVNPGGYFGGSATQYFIGHFDGTKFICDNQPDVTKWLDWGKDYYASIRVPKAGERVIAEAWMNNKQYCHTLPSNQSDSISALPRELQLYAQEGDFYLSTTPVRDAISFQKENKQLPSFTVDKDYHIESILPDNEGAYELSMNIITGKAEIMGFSLFNDKGEKVDIYFNLPEKRLVMDRTKCGKVDLGQNNAPHKVDGYDHRKTASINYINDFALATWAPIGKEDTYELNVFIDKCSVEIFLNGGKLAMTNLVFPSVPYNRMCFYSKGGTFKVDSFHVYKLSL